MSGLIPVAGNPVQAQLDRVRSQSPRRTAAARLVALAALATSALWVPSPAAAQGPAALGPQTAPGSAMAGTQSAGAVVCPPGSNQGQVVVSGCFPGDCISFQTLDWGLPGSPPGPLQVPKFDPALGNLQRVDIGLRFDLNSTLCLDNTASSCCLAEISALFQATANPAATNVPQVTGWTSAQIAETVSYTPAGFFLGQSDGNDSECQTGNFTGPPSDGSCVPGQDHFFTTFSGSFFSTSVTLSGNDVSPWILAPSAPPVVEFETQALGLISNSNFCSTLTPDPDSQGRVEMIVRYTYCTNAPPICTDKDVTTAEDTSVDIPVLDGVVDPDGQVDCTTLQITSGPTHGTLSIGAGCGGFDCQGGCLVTYTPDPNYCGPDSFVYEVSDDEGASSGGCTVTIDVTPVNDPPVALDDQASTPEDTPVTIDVCANDSDVDDANGCGAPLDCTTVEIVSQPDCGGSAKVQPDGRVLLTPPADFCGACTFTYLVRDTAGAPSNVATVTVDVTGVNDPPVALDDAGTTAEDTPVQIPVLTNDFDVDSKFPGCGAPLDPSSVVIVTPPDCGGTAVPNAQGVVTFTPAPDFCGVCTFQYTVDDTAGATSNVATVTVDVTAVNDPPVAADDAYSIQEDDSEVILTVLDNDFDVDEGNGCGAPLDPSSIHVVTPPDCIALAQPLANGTIRFTPQPDFCGTCTFQYTVDDTAGATSNVATVTVDVTAVNDPPVAADDVATTPEDTPVDIDVCVNDSDPDEANGCGDPLDCPTVTIVQSPDCGGTAQVLPSGVVRFTPPPDHCGDCTFTYVVADTAGLTSNEATVTVTITPVNDPPICSAPGPFTTNEGQSIDIDLCLGASDPDDANGCGEPLDCSGAVIVGTPVGGTVVLNGDGTATFVPDAGFCDQQASFQYAVRDAGGLESAPCTVLIDVQAVNEAPVCSSPPAQNEVAEGGSIVIDLCPFVSDPDGATGCGADVDCTTIEPVGAPSCGGTVVANGDGTVTFTAPVGFCGPCEFSYTVRDFAGLSSTASCPVTVVVTPVNEAVIAVDDTATTNEGQPKVVDVLANDSDPDDASGCGCTLDPSTVVVTTPPAAGQAIVNANGSITYTPAEGTCGDFTFDYEVSDTDGGGPACTTSSATVTVTVLPVNEAPVAMDDSAATPMDTPIDIEVCANDSDPDEATGCGAPLDCTTVTIVQQPDCGGTVTVDPATGIVTFTPPNGFIGTCCFTYTVDDTDGAISNEATVCVEVLDNCLPTNLRNPGSLLLFPAFDSRDGVTSIFTITNISNEDVYVKFEYVDADDCSRFDRTELLTGRDTFTAVVNGHNPNQEQGFFYAYAVCQNGEPIVANVLIGNLLTINGIDSFEFSMNAAAFPGIGDGQAPTSCLLPGTDIDGDDVRDLDGVEYGPVPDQILVPRFFGQSPANTSEMILIALSGGPQFETTVDFLVYNDNEEVFSAETTFYCWARVPLLEINNVFDNDFLALSTNDDPNEVVGANAIETGWIRVNGAVANSVNTSILDPAIYAIVIEGSQPLGGDLQAADLPWGLCSQQNGGLLPRGNDGNH